MEKISSSIRKTIRSLSSPKGRRIAGAFITERTKNVLDIINGPYKLRWLIALNEWYETHSEIAVEVDKCLVATKADMERMTSMNTPSDVIAVFDLPEPTTGFRPHPHKLYIALDAIQDPGNMGTILRLADWFGVDTILASHDTVDVFNPKCVISSMGSIARVKVIYTDLTNELESAARDGNIVWGTFMNGENLYNAITPETARGIVVFGNEGNGISQRVSETIQRAITIPQFSITEGAESLNVAMATAITLSEFRRLSTNLKS